MTLRPYKRSWKDDRRKKLFDFVYLLTRKILGQEGLLEILRLLNSRREPYDLEMVVIRWSEEETFPNDASFDQKNLIKEVISLEVWKTALVFSNGQIQESQQILKYLSVGAIPEAVDRKSVV